jgi:signal transduction histidine kinase
LRARTYERGQGINATVALTRQPTILDEYQASPYALPELANVRATLTVPILFEGRLLGVLHSHTTQPDRRFTPDDLRRFQMLASQAAIAIENAQLYEAVQRHAAELEVRVQERTRELAAANQQLEAASRHKSEFLANMSHELRTPLNSILGFSQLLLEQTQEVLPAKQIRFLTNIHNSGQHLLQLINDILDLSKVEAGKFILQPEPLPVAATLEDILVIGRGLANKKGQLIETEIAPELPPLQADPVRFKQILFNLLSNAIKFTPAGGRITVTVRRICDFRFPIADSKNIGPEPQSQIANHKSQIRDFVEIAVADTGAGIRPEDLAKLFQEFVQLETTRAQKHEGTGLGLALTRRLVELHGGQIWAESEGEGKGATFTVVLPFGEPVKREE